MREKAKQLDGRQEGVQRDEQLGSLLRSSSPSTPLLNWGQIEQLVAAAPPVHMPWYAALLASPAPLRYAGAPLLALLVAGGTLWVMPAQSEQVGTIVSTALPRQWESDTAALRDVQTAAGQALAAQGLTKIKPQVMSIERRGQDQLVLMLMEARAPQAQAVVGSLQQQYPLLAAQEATYTDIQASPAANRLLQLVDHVEHAAGTRQGKTRMAREILSALHGSGLDKLDITGVERQPDGSLVVEIEASFSINVDGHTQEESAAGGGKPVAPGQADAGQLLQAIDSARR